MSRYAALLITDEGLRIKSLGDCADFDEAERQAETVQFFTPGRLLWVMDEYDIRQVRKDVELLPSG